MTFFSLGCDFFIAKVAVWCLFYIRFVTFYNERLQFDDVFSLDGDNKYFQVCELLSQFYKHLASF